MNERINQQVIKAKVENEKMRQINNQTKNKFKKAQAEKKKEKQIKQIKSQQINQRVNYYVLNQFLYSKISKSKTKNSFYQRKIFKFDRLVHFPKLEPKKDRPFSLIVIPLLNIEEKKEQIRQLEGKNEVKSLNNKQLIINKSKSQK
ncbi:hypothetical protein TTHERM_000277258 (macronuclear) [Tetrahymena thermophila SB210]|uniref:Uncharacterized protein n=1 Tax=Tetrahymena thermophila (strain SB210) TaxID=312017 RepID=W7X915_TETTS|nr:hypothetical protein TTHERM_000277258 [Tetrahymena thermophila SB210]EWS73837.1 hypothetical protein TTHERM_000277258 [Tetrahymena thermophila SB210]|eukprot:XP_012653584.1 hypothetical protein TTHERM_000277258 [Tetrahymena thermophila SB210]